MCCVLCFEIRDVCFLNWCVVCYVLCCVFCELCFVYMVRVFFRYLFSGLCFVCSDVAWCFVFCV